MSTPYDREFRFTTTGTDEIVELDYPGRCEITKITAVRDGGGAIDFDFYNRKFDSDALPIYEIIEQIGGEFDGKTKLRFLAEVGVTRPGDQIAVAGTSVAPYNTTHRVEHVSDDKKEIITDQTFSARALGGTLTLAISAADQELYRVMANISAASPVISIPPATGDSILFVNKDPLGNNNIGTKRKIYLKVAAADTYRVAITSLLGVAGEG
jgi:hypothetical protein